ncbi:MAG TPA: hypothetical protein VMU89_00345 [Thermomicrobiaceae bacterium]|nr:hypothetical protein [Thermomicrobiaceae bacterium]
MIEIEFLWFSDCPNHAAARALLVDVLKARGLDVPIRDVDATAPAIAQRLRFPGSPTIRVNGTDVMPGFRDPGDYTPRCRVYHTAAGLRGVPERGWIEAAVDAALTEAS